jgi:hypothetical protein
MWINQSVNVFLRVRDRIASLAWTRKFRFGAVEFLRMLSTHRTMLFTAESTPSAISVPATSSWNPDNIDAVRTEAT